MNVIKPRGLGILTKVYQDRPALYLSIGVLGYFDFDQPGAFLPDTALWPFVQSQLPENTPLDLGMPKVCAEVLVFGKAVAPQGVPVPALPVEFAIGGLRKRAVIHGDRYWKLGTTGLRPTEPKPFLEMPIDYAHAFGGAGYARNPVGKGFDAERRTRQGEAVGLPNVEAPDRPVVTASDRPEPYGFGPLDIAWADRTAKAGTFDDSWFKTRSPSAPLDQDPTLYNAAPPDQWRRDGWFALDEPFALAGFQAEHPVDRGRLPGMRARSFIRQKQPDGATALLEIGLHLETIFLFASARKGVVLYRGRVAVSDIDGRDVTDVMIAYERMADEPRSPAHYIEVLKLRTDPETKGLHAMNDLQLAPALPPEIEAERAAEREEYAAAALAKRQRRLDRAYDAALAAGGLRLKPGVPRPKALPSVFPTITPQDIARGEVDIAGFVAAARRELGIAQHHAAESRAKGLAVMAEARAKQAARAAAAPAAAPPPAVSLKPLHDLHARLAALKGPDLSSGLAKLEGALTPRKPGIGQEVTALEGRVESAETRGEANLAQTLDGVRRRLLAAPQRDSAQMTTALRSVEHALHPPSPLAHGAIAAPDPEAQAAASTRAALARAVEAAPPAARGELLAKAETTEAAFAKAAASRAAPAAAIPPVTFSAGKFEKLPAGEAPPPRPPLTDAEKAALKAKMAAVRDEAERKSRLHNPTAMAPATPLDPETAQRLREAVAEAAAQGSSLSGCDLAGSDLSGLSFRGLDLTGALFEKANLAGADFSGAQLAHAVFTEADLAGARFDQADLRDTNFCGVSAPGASLVDADLSEARLLYANFDGADLTGASFERSIIQEARFKDAVLRQTRWQKCSLMMSALAGADLSEARLTLCNFMKCDLTGSRFRGATLFRVAVTSCPADGADFSEARLARMIASGGSSFVGGIFRRACAGRSNWFKVDLSRADFTRAELDRAFIGEAKAVEACFYRASLQQAFLAGTDFTDADFSEANLFKANLRHAVLDRAELRHASLYCAVTDGARWQLADLTRANLRLTVFARG